MNDNTVVAVFDSRADAERAVQRLEDAGIERSAIDLDQTEGEGGNGLGTSSSGEKRGFFARLFGLGEDDDNAGHYDEAVRRGGTVLTVEVDQHQIDTVSGILEDCGAVDIDERIEQWRSGAGAGTGMNATAPGFSPDDIAAERESRLAGSQADETLPVVQEELKIGKREVARGRVRVHRRVTETPVEEQVALREERAVVDRRRVDRPAQPGELENLGDETLEFVESAEEPVVEKSARVVEEVRLGKDVKERTETVRDTVRRSEVEIENATADDGGSGRPTGTLTRTDKPGKSAKGTLTGASATDSVRGSPTELPPSGRMTGGQGSGASNPAAATPPYGDSGGDRLRENAGDTLGRSRDYDGPERRQSVSKNYFGTERRKVAMT